MNKETLHKIKKRLGVEGNAMVRTLKQFVLAALGFSAVPLKQRHFFTREGKLRLRYIAFVLIGFFGFVSAFNVDDSKNHLLLPTETPILQNFGDWQTESEEAGAGVENAPELPPLQDAYVLNPFLGDPAASKLTGEPLVPTKKPLVAPANEWTNNLLIQSGDTLPALLAMAGLNEDQVDKAIPVLKPYLTTKDLVSGHSIRIDHKRIQGKVYITAIEFPENGLISVFLKPTAQAGFTAERVTKPLKREIRAVRAVIRSALYNDLSRAGVPHELIIELIKSFSYTVDFARDVWEGDKIEILYDVDRTDDGDFVRGNELLLARIYLRGKVQEIVKFKGKTGTAEFFDALGKTNRRAFLQTPVDGARITSGFGVRRHPLLGYTKMHKGVDFGAPTGTPIFAAGDGVIERAGWVGGYGNFIKIKHNGTYSTGYGHMSRFNKGIRSGTRVRQGQVIGFVGSTGRSTGPHLHFELIKNGTQINPRSVANVSLNNGLGASEMVRFKAQREEYRKKFAALLDGGKLPPDLTKKDTKIPETTIVTKTVTPNKKATTPKAKPKAKKETTKKHKKD